MTDAELQAWWPSLGTVVVEFRSTGRTAEAERFVDAVRAGATSGEILDAVGVLLREHWSLRSQLSPPAATAWDAVVSDVRRGSRGRGWRG